jgi:hypothetical protein
VGRFRLYIGHMRVDIDCIHIIWGRLDSLIANEFVQGRELSVPGKCGSEAHVTCCFVYNCLIVH